MKPAIFGIKAANHSHVFFSNTKEGKVSIYKTNGNSDSHIILRGGKEPNLHPEDVKKTIESLNDTGTNNSIMIDVSHANSKKVFKRQIENCEIVANQIASGTNELRGVMIESHLLEGNQKISRALEYGKSITDACIDWEDTVNCLQILSDAVEARRKK